MLAPDYLIIALLHARQFAAGGWTLEAREADGRVWALWFLPVGNGCNHVIAWHPDGWWQVTSGTSLASKVCTTCEEAIQTWRQYASA